MEKPVISLSQRCFTMVQAGLVDQEAQPTHE
jgi:hypothetical protein